MSKRFRIALSFAGEKRDFVKEVAALLAAKFGREKVLYDNYHEEEFARADLAFHLPKLYNDNADLIVVVLCKEYQEKPWPGLEWKAIFGLLKKRKEEEVMLCRFDEAQGEGLFGLEGYLELDEKTPEQAAELMMKRLERIDRLAEEERARAVAAAAAALAGANVLEAANAGPNWPTEAPELQWPVADHTEAREAFAKLITRGSRHRYLPIAGPTEMGKSHLSKQFLRNALTIEHLRCGRFDFKGSADIDAVIPEFMDNLNVPPPDKAAELTAQLSQIVASLRDVPKPTLLIFDTFEQAGKAEKWMETLLVKLPRAPWLRVVVVGQKVPPSREQMWADVSAPQVNLKSPSAEEWFTYGRKHHPDVTLEEVATVHRRSGGRSFILAQLFGPAEAQQ